MAQAVRYPKKTVDRYVRHLAKDIKVSKVLLFGSFAYGTPDKHSDVDLIVVSPDFRGRDFWDRAQWLTLQRRGIATDIAMDVIGYTPSEFRAIEKESAIAGFAKKHGRVVFRS